MSHDLRTPLAVITGAATSAADPAVAAPARAELLESIVGEARRLERMLANLLQLTRVETGLVPHREWIPLDELVGGALTRMEAWLGACPVEAAGGDRDRRRAVLDRVLDQVDEHLLEQDRIDRQEQVVGHRQLDRAR